MSRLRKYAAATFAAAAVVAGGLVAAAPANASYYCATNYVCLYDYDNYTGLLEERSGGSVYTWNLPVADRDKTASWGNDSLYDTGLYDELNGTGTCWQLNAKSNGSFTWTVRDRAESWRTANGC